MIALIIGLLWRLGEPPALLMAVGLQLSQIVTPLLYANFLGVPLQRVSLNVGDLSSAIWFALAAMVSLVVGIWCGQWGARAHAAPLLQQEARVWSPRAAFVFCIATILLAAGFDTLGAVLGGLRQPCLAASRVQWVGVFVLTCACTAQRRGFKYLLFVMCLEVVKGFTGFFSDFKEVFFVVLLGIFSTRPKLDVRSMIAGFAVCSVVVTLGVFWSAIKDDYRVFVSQGSQAQAVLVSLEDRLSYLANRIGEVDWYMMSRGLDSLVTRLGYVDFLSATMRNVPSHLPFQDGAHIGATVMHVLQPRLLFPDKPPLLSDTDVVEKYTGLHFGDSSSAGTSVSLGYLAELYIDFGVLGSLGVMFILGVLFGRSFKFICSSSSLSWLVTFGLGVMLVMPVMQFEQALAKTVGGFLTTFITIVVLKLFLFPSLLRMLGEPSRAGTRPTTRQSR